MTRTTPGWRRVLTAMALVAVVVGAGADGGAAPVAQAARQPTDRLAGALRNDLQSYLDAHGAQDRFTAVSLRVTGPNRRPATAVSVSAGRPVPDHALWQIGSNTKAFTSVVLLQLEAEGRLSIHDRLGTWLPRYPAWRDVTIAQLLSMTSGIPDYSEQDAFGAAFLSDPTATFTADRLVSSVTGLPLGPATYAYSNTNYILAQMIIERVTHDSYAAQLSRRVLVPLGMRDTCLPPACRRAPPVGCRPGTSGTPACPCGSASRCHRSPCPGRRGPAGWSVRSRTSPRGRGRSTGAGCCRPPSSANCGRLSP